MRSVKLSAFLAPIRLRYLFLVTMALALIFFSLAYLGIKKARQSLTNIMVTEGKALIESLTLSSTNAIQSGLLLESLSEEKLVEIAATAQNQLTGISDSEEFRLFCEEQDLMTLEILDTSLVVVGSNQWAKGYIPDYPDKVKAEIIEILRFGGGYRSVLIYGDDSLSSVYQYFVYELTSTDETSPPGLMVLTVQANYIEQILRQIGIGYLIQEISGQAGIEYIFLQSNDGIVFSSKSLPPVLSIENDPFLESLMPVDTVGWRIHRLEDYDVLEIARRFESVSYPPGIYRIGMNLDEFHSISDGYDRQIIITAIVLFLITLLIVAVVSINQNYFILDKSFRQMKSRTETIFDQLTSAVLAYDTNGKIIAVNNAFFELTGIGTKNIDDSIDEIAANIPFVLSKEFPPGQAIISQELEIKTPQNQLRTILLGATGLPEKAGGGVVILIHDITRRKKLEEENRRRERLVEMGDMAAGVAHEIRNPLNAIGIAAQRLKMEFNPPEDREEYHTLTKNILSETERLNQILTRFLDLARSKTKEDTPVDLNEAIERGINSVVDEAKQNGITINFLAGKSIMVRCQIEKLQQVFINLIRNSIQFMKFGGQVIINVLETDNEGVLITVSDTGPGFDDEVLSKIFQPYFTTKADGSGLGLALAYKTISECGGTVEASNHPNGGAVIKINLPLA
ncbi:MAG: ATP-binding protein [candidate division Zixibacteria bacterium]